MQGEVFNVQRFSLNDGNGIRTTVFLCGCTLQCRWCHNPEGRSPTPPLQYLSSRCIGCHACEAACPNQVHLFKNGTHAVDLSRCASCGRCVQACPANGLRTVAKIYTPQELTQEVLHDLPFFKQNGGVTFSGGEPLMQADFIAESAKQMKQSGVPTVAVDTAGNIAWTEFEKVLDLTDVFLYDVKAYTEELHREGTGCSNALILENLQMLDRAGAKIHIRIPVIGGFNNSVEELGRIASFVSELNHVQAVTLIPYHRLGNEKYASIGLSSEMERYHEISDDALQEHKKLFQGIGKTKE